ncbi:MAG: hypothetical protein Q8Q35_03430 [Nanoarchaeota archaeon]|nr:hypothetical protein [Nanoarchaeota archaeon]
MENSKDYTFIEQCRGGENLPEIDYLANSHLPKDRCLAAAGYAVTGLRESFEKIGRLVFDNDSTVRNDAIIALGVSGDSRAYFVLANIFLKAEDIYDKDVQSAKRSVLYAFKSSRDPRAVELTKLAEKTDGLEEIAKQTLKDINIAKSQRIESELRLFEYNFEDSDTKLESAKSSDLGTIIQSLEDLEKIEKILKRRNEGKLVSELYQTYVVDNEGNFLLGGDIEEHVEVMGGENIIAAGEAIVKKENGNWIFVELNNRSNGYYPDGSCYEYVKNALKKTGIVFPNEFKEIFPREGWLDSNLLEVKWKEFNKLLEIE